MNNWLGSTIEQDKKIHWDWQSTWINNWLGLTVNYCSTFTDSSQHIYCIIAVCLKHYCSTYMVPFEHIYNTIAAHLITAILLYTKFKLSIWAENFFFYLEFTSTKRISGYESFQANCALTISQWNWDQYCPVTMDMDIITRKVPSVPGYSVIHHFVIDYHYC